MSMEAISQTSNDERRQVYGMQPWTREGKPFNWVSLAHFLTSQEFSIPSECLFANRFRVFCIDDGIETDDYRQRIIPISGSGAGEDLNLVRAVLENVPLLKIKPHARCGKAAKVLGSQREEEGRSSPTPEEIDEFAMVEAEKVGRELGLEVKRMIGFDSRVTRLTRPVDFHPADGAVVGLSMDFLHNLVGRKKEQETPHQFRLAGHYYHDPRLHRFAVREAMLANTIASSEHGVGVISRGFRLTALVNEADPRMEELVFGAIRVFELLEDEVSTLRQAGEKINAVHLDILSYAPDSDGNTCTNRFATVETF